MKSIVLSIIICLNGLSAAGQDFDLLGIVDDQLIKINSSNAEIEFVGFLTPAPTDYIRFLTYAEDECMIYGIMSSGSNPILVSIDLDLNFTEIGDLYRTGGPLYFCEGLSYNRTENALFASVSLNGNQSGGDYYSETLVEVNRTNAECTYKTEIVGSVNDPDQDRITFCGDSLFYYDGQPNQFGKFFELDFPSLGFTSQGDELYSGAYIRLLSLECLNGNLYYTLGRDLSFFNTATGNLEYLGDLFSSSDLKGEELSGLCHNPFPDFSSLNDSITICNENDYLLELEYPYETVQWNNGSIGNTQLVSESGAYWADITYNNCLFRTDTIYIDFVLPLDVTLGQDTVICDGSALLLTISAPDILVVWSNGIIGNQIEVSESGTYWAQYALDGCIFYTDTITVDIFDDLYSLGMDVSLCGDETHTLFVEGAGSNVFWNNGYNGNPILITEPGFYWAEVITQECEFMTDTIEIFQIMPVDFNMNKDTAICKGDTILFTINDPNVDVIWSDGSIGNKLKICEPGTYWAEYVIDDCTFYSDTIMVSYIQNLDLFIGTHTTLCKGDSLLITIEEPSVEIFWSNGTIGDNLIISETGLYWAEYYIDGCKFTTDSIFVEFIEYNFDIGQDITLCEGESHTIYLDDAGQDVYWSNGYNGAQLVITEPGIYWAEVTIDDCVFLTNAIEVSYVQYVEQEIASDTVICAGEVLNYSIDIPNSSILWSDGTNENEITIEEEGYYWGQYIIGECTFYTDTIYVTVFDEELYIGSDTIFCEGENYILTLEGFGQNISWNTGDVGNQLEITESGTYWAEIILNNCQVETNSFTVNTIPIVEIEIGTDSVLCDGEELILSVQNPIVDYQWNTGEFGDEIIVSEAGTYWASTKDYQCPSQSDTVQVDIIENPEVIFNLDTLVCEKEELFLSHNLYDIKWNSNYGEDLISINESGDYWGIYQIEKCLFFTDTIHAEFVDCTPCAYHFPNVISPNFDGINDDFKVVFSNSCNIINIEIIIFDRWGNQVCKSNENFWDGLHNNKQVVNGVYAYLIDMKVRMYNGVEQEVSVIGDVTILK